MTEASVLNLVNLRRIGTGRRRFAVGKLKTLANAEADSVLVALCDHSLAHDQQTAELQAKRGEQRRRARTKPPLSPAVLIDKQIDSAIAGVDAKLVSELKAYADGSEEHTQLQNHRAMLLPNGVLGITRKPHVEQLDLVKGFLRRATELESTLAGVGASKLLERIRSLVIDFEQVLLAEGETRVTADRVRAATLKGNELLCNLVVYVLAKTLNQEDPQLVTQRQRLLAPILEQDEIVYEYNRLNRKVPDIDPATGNEVEAEDEN